MAKDNPIQKKGRNHPPSAEPITTALINPRKERMCKEFTDPDSEGYGNQSKAADIAGYDDSHGRRLFAQDATIAGRVAGILERAGAGHQVRAASLAGIMRGEYLQTVTTTEQGKDRNGKSVKRTRTVLKAPSAADVVKAVDISNKADGTYAQQKTVAEAVGAELSELYKRQRKELSAHK